MVSSSCSTGLICVEELPIGSLFIKEISLLCSVLNFFQTRINLTSENDRHSLTKCSQGREGNSKVATSSKK